MWAKGVSKGWKLPNPMQSGLVHAIVSVVLKPLFVLMAPARNLGAIWELSFAEQAFTDLSCFALARMLLSATEFFDFDGECQCTPLELPACAMLPALLTD